MARVDTTFLSTNTFATLGAHPATVRGLREKMGYEAMTKVQALTIPYALQGCDIVAKAQTGTGKTIAFLVPVINRVAARGPSTSLGAIILSPTRELANQIHNEAVDMLAFHKDISAVVVVGGTNISKDVKALQRVDILIATPGRLIDHIQNTPGFAARLTNLECFVLDEADRMLDMGFRPDIERIIAATGGPRKQTLLFSATVAPEVIELAPKLLAPQFMFADAGTGKTAIATAGGAAKDGVMRLVADDPFVTAKQVTQEIAFVEQAHQIQAVVDVLLRERQIPGHKVMVFFTTARLTQLFAELFQAIGCPVLEIHSRKSQNHRQKTSDAFRDGTNVMMFSSDVTARGMDYPDVTLVLQVGLPSSGEQYVHRLGRTGRAGMKGRGVLLLMPEEKYFLKQIEQLRITEIKLPASQIPASVVGDAILRVSADTRAMAYAAWLGFYNSFASKLKWSKEYLVTRANLFATESLGFRSPPPLQKKTIGKMGLKGVPGLVIEGTVRETYDDDDNVQPTRQQPMPRARQPQTRPAAPAAAPTRQVVGAQVASQPVPNAVVFKPRGRGRGYQHDGPTNAPAPAPAPAPQRQVVGAQLASQAAPNADVKPRGRGRGSPQDGLTNDGSRSVRGGRSLPVGAEPAQNSTAPQRGSRGGRSGYASRGGQ